MYNKLFFFKRDTILVFTGIQCYRVGLWLQKHASHIVFQVIFKDFKGETFPGHINSNYIKITLIHQYNTYRKLSLESTYKLVVPHLAPKRADPQSPDVIANTNKNSRWQVNGKKNEPWQALAFRNYKTCAELYKQSKANTSVNHHLQRTDIMSVWACALALFLFRLHSEKLCCEWSKENRCVRLKGTA